MLAFWIANHSKRVICFLLVRLFIWEVCPLIVVRQVWVVILLWIHHSLLQLLCSCMLPSKLGQTVYLSLLLLLKLFLFDLCEDIVDSFSFLLLSFLIYFNQKRSLFRLESCGLEQEKWCFVYAIVLLNFLLVYFWLILPKLLKITYEIVDLCLVSTILLVLKSFLLHVWNQLSNLSQKVLLAYFLKLFLALSSFLIDLHKGNIKLGLCALINHIVTKAIGNSLRVVVSYSPAHGQVALWIRACLWESSRYWGGLSLEIQDFLVVDEVALQSWLHSALGLLSRRAGGARAAAARVTAAGAGGWAWLSFCFRLFICDIFLKSTVRHSFPHLRCIEFKSE